MRLMVVLSLLINVAVLLPVCAGSLHAIGSCTAAAAARSSFGSGK